jgi:hypothetical protein
MHEGIFLFVVQENEGLWAAASVELGSGFLVTGPSRDDVVLKVETLLAPLVAHGLRYRFYGDVQKQSPVVQ